MIIIIDLEHGTRYNAVDCALERLIGSRVVLERRSPELRFSGYLTMSPGGEWVVVKAGIGGEVRGEYAFASEDVTSINGVVILLRDKIDFSKLASEETTEDDACESCGENRINYLTWLNDISIRCETCGAEFLSAEEDRRLNDIRWDMAALVGFKDVLVIEKGKEFADDKHKEYEQLLALRHGKDLWAARNGCVCQLLDTDDVKDVDRRLRTIYVREGWIEGTVTVRK